MTVWIITLTALTLLNALGTAALSTITYNRMRETNFRIAAVSDATISLHRRINQHLGELPTRAPTEEESGRIEALIKKHYRKPPQ
ncbi:hypothetical protein [Corynebacterium sp. Marseille-P4611]|uniref:hypothetical protein n=1 Tax=Corynebacterium sp. Marseille-P4611 TaxID=2866575 RepID=UPI001CE4B51F|nr:hypothetical protein [Corynebacterium sp. Marseille-P4611]